MATLTRTGAALVLSMLWVQAAANGAEAPAAGLEQQGAPQGRRGPAITAGVDGNAAWFIAHYKQLQLRKRTDPQTRFVTIEVRVGADAVAVVVAGERVSVARGGRELSLSSPEALESLQMFLAGSTAVFATRAMLSELESTSALQGHELSLLASAAFVASLVGDVEAPRRIADRFVEKHRGIYRLIRGGGRETCWSDYAKETTAAWNDLQACMQEAEDDGFFSGAYQRIACNATWLLRGESAWFEYLKCLSPLGSIPRI